MPDNKHYLDRVTPQHKRPKFLAWLESNLQPYLDAENLLKSMDDDFDIDQSVGVQLNVTGDIVGRNRVLSFDPADGSSPTLDDETYRLLQKAKIAINQWDGTIPSVLELWVNLFPQYGLIVQDNQDMTMDYMVSGDISPLEWELLTKHYLTPKPVGVRINFVFLVAEDVYGSNYHSGGVSDTIEDYILRPEREPQIATIYNAAITDEILWEEIG